jgi:Ricin-type beta-trefoil lectin domain
MEGTASMKPKSSTIAALGILFSVGTAYAGDDETWRDGKSLVSLATTMAGYYTDAKDVWDVAIKAGQFIGWLNEPRTLDQVEQDLTNYINNVYQGIYWADRAGTISDVNGKFTAAIEHLQDRLPLAEKDQDDTDTIAGLTTILGTSDSDGREMFARPYDYTKDQKLSDDLNNYCTTSKTDANQKNNFWPGGCVYSKADLVTDASNHPPYSVNFVPPPGPIQGLLPADLVYDWHQTLPPLMLFIAYRVQMIAAMHPDFFQNPDNHKGERDELNRYHDALYKHYYKILGGIKCGRYAQICAEVHSGLRYNLVAGKDPDGLWRYGVYAALPLYDLKKMIDTLYLYTHPNAADLARNFHRLPYANSPPSLCLKEKKQERGSTAIMDTCDGSTAQQWVYDRVNGTVINSGSVANPASGQCLGVTGSVHYDGTGVPLPVTISTCIDPAQPDYKSQQWTYDPESKVLLNHLGTALEIDWSDPEYKVTSVYYWSSPLPGFQWNADQPTRGTPSFSNTMGPGETMKKGQSRVSPNNQYELLLQTDGNLVLYEKMLTDNPPIERAKPLWASDTNGKKVDRVVMESDGNLAIYPPAARQICSPVSVMCSNPIWATGMHGHPLSHLTVEDDGTVVIYDKQSTPIWTVPVPTYSVP